LLAFPNHARPTVTEPIYRRSSQLMQHSMSPGAQSDGRITCDCSGCQRLNTKDVPRARRWLLVLASGPLSAFLWNQPQEFFGNV
ncbi:hypothetical protein L9F63_008252, partial [Diploptera punctata]